MCACDIRSHLKLRNNARPSVYERKRERRTSSTHHVISLLFIYKALLSLSSTQACESKALREVLDETAASDASHMCTPKPQVALQNSSD